MSTQTDKLAGHLYWNYCQAVGGKAFNGDLLPDWEAFKADPYKKKQMEAWLRVAETAQQALLPLSVEKMQSENTCLRALVAKHDCPYGHRKEGVCELGYPGCACMDDLYVGEEFVTGALKQQLADVAKAFDPVKSWYCGEEGSPNTLASMVGWAADDLVESRKRLDEVAKVLAPIRAWYASEDRPTPTLAKMAEDAVMQWKV